MSRVLGVALIVCIVFVLSISMTIAQQSLNLQCKIAWPQFGTISCKVYYGSNPLTEPKGPSCSGSNCQFTFSCVGRAECQISPNDINIQCPTLQCYSYTVTKDGGTPSQEFNNCGLGFTNKPSDTVDRFSSVVIQGTCKFGCSGSSCLYTGPFQSSSQVTMTYQNKYLYQTTPDQPGEVKVDQSVGCIPQGLVSKYLQTPVGVSTQFVDNQGNPQAGPSNPLKDIASLPTNMNPGDTYSYFYGWREVGGINAVVGKDGQLSGYCGGTIGNRILLAYSQVQDSITNGCWIIPTTKQRNVECCSNEDCKFNNNGKTVCDTSTFTCSDQKPCNSDIECQVPGQAADCSNKVQTSWKCDLTQKWYPYQGTCTKSTQNVQCCSDNDCPDPNAQYCNRDKGCLAKFNLADCPSGKWCKAGGNYKPQSCDTGLTACSSNDQFIGDCKTSCENLQISSQTPNPLNTITPQLIDPSSPSFIAIIAAVVVGVVGLIAYIFLKNRGKEESLSKNESKKDDKDLLRGDV